MNNGKSNYKYRPYQSFIINNKIVPEPQTFQAKNGRTYTRLVFHIPGFQEFSVLDFEYNTVTHMIKIVENRFTETLLNEINSYLMNTTDQDPGFKKVTQIAPNGQSAKEQKFDKLFDDTPSAPEAQQPKQEEESDDMGN